MSSLFFLPQAIIQNKFSSKHGCSSTNQAKYVLLAFMASLQIKLSLPSLIQI
jgi:hypothetical protein